MSWGLNPSRKTLVIHDTDLHGLSCGVNALRALRSAGMDADVYAHFSTNPNEPATSPLALAIVIEILGLADLYILDIPVDIRNPKRYIAALISHARYKGRVIWMDHHGHSQWIDELNRNGVFAVVYGSSYELSLAVPRMFGRVDSFAEKWALIGALADFDETIASKVPTWLEIDVAEYLDQAWKFRREDMFRAMGYAYKVDAYKTSSGNVGFATKIIVEEQVEPERMIEVAKTLVSPIQLPPYRTVGDVGYTTELHSRD